MAINKNERRARTWVVFRNITNKLQRVLLGFDETADEFIVKFGGTLIYSGIDNETVEIVYQKLSAQDERIRRDIVLGFVHDLASCVGRNGFSERDVFPAAEKLYEEQLARGWVTLATMVNRPELVVPTDGGGT